MRKIATVVAGVVMAVAGSVALPGVASAGTANCPSGYFCAWEHSSYNGYRVNWYGYDGYWENNGINNRSSSWQNNGITGPGIPAHVRVYDGFYGAGSYLLCLAPGTRIHYNANANDRPSSHYWRYGC